MMTMKTMISSREIITITTIAGTHNTMMTISRMTSYQNSGYTMCHISVLSFLDYVLSTLSSIFQTVIGFSCQTVICFVHTSGSPVRQWIYKRHVSFFCHFYTTCLRSFFYPRARRWQWLRDRQWFAISMRAWRNCETMDLQASRVCLYSFEMTTVTITSGSGTMSTI